MPPLVVSASMRRPPPLSLASTRRRERSTSSTCRPSTLRPPLVVRPSSSALASAGTRTVTPPFVVSTVTSPVTAASAMSTPPLTVEALTSPPRPRALIWPLTVSSCADAVTFTTSISPLVVSRTTFVLAGTFTIVANLGRVPPAGQRGPAALGAQLHQVRGDLFLELQPLQEVGGAFLGGGLGHLDRLHLDGRARAGHDLDAPVGGRDVERPAGRQREAAGDGLGRFLARPGQGDVAGGGERRGRRRAAARRGPAGEASSGSWSVSPREWDDEAAAKVRRRAPEPRIGLA